MRRDSHDDDGDKKRRKGREDKRRKTALEDKRAFEGDEEKAEVVDGRHTS